MEAPKEHIKTRTSYNLAAVSFTPAELAAAIRLHMPSFNIQYAPDFRQQIADSWPASIDDSAARTEWGWNHHFDTAGIVKEMLENLKDA